MSYTVQGLRQMQRDCHELTKLGLSDEEYRRRARGIMERQKAHDRPLIEAYIKRHGMPEDHPDLGGQIYLSIPGV
jgi:hypothetical protein